MLVLLAFISACGFQLRGGHSLPDGLQPLYLNETGDDDLRRELTTLLRASKVELANTAELATASLKLSNQRINRRVLSVDTRGRAREYELNYSVLYTITSKQLNAENVVRLQRELLFDPDNVLGASVEEQTLYRDMKRDAARLIMQQMQAMKPVSMTNQSIKSQGK